MKVSLKFDFNDMNDSISSNYLLPKLCSFGNITLSYMLDLDP